MHWEEARRLYPDKWVQLEVISSHMNEDKKVVDEVAVIRSIDTDQWTFACNSNFDISR